MGSNHRTCIRHVVAVLVLQAAVKQEAAALKLRLVAAQLLRPLLDGNLQRHCVHDQPVCLEEREQLGRRWSRRRRRRFGGRHAGVLIACCLQSGVSSRLKATVWVVLGLFVGGDMAVPITLCRLWADLGKPGRPITQHSFPSTRKRPRVGLDVGRMKLAHRLSALSAYQRCEAHLTTKTTHGAIGAS